MIARARGRHTFARLTQEGSRVRRSTLWCTWCPQPDPSDPTEVAFSIGRALGPAVVRNRLRRRLRAILRELDRADALPPVVMLIGATPATTALTFDQLHNNMVELISAIPV